MTSCEIRIHLYAYVRLGGRHYWDWGQKDISVPYWRIYWNCVGGAFIHTRLGKLELTPDEIILLPPHTEYSTYARSEVGHFYAHFSADRPFSQMPPHVFRLGSAPLLSQASSLAQEVAMDRESVRAQLKVEIYVRSALLCLPEKEVPRLSLRDSRVQRALSILAKRTTVSNTELAEAVGMSRNGFLNLFRQEAGMAPQAYSRRRRLEEASVQLHFSESPISAIAEAAGFSDRYHFTKAFKCQFGIGPGEYRRRFISPNKGHGNC